MSTPSFASLSHSRRSIVRARLRNLSAWKSPRRFWRSLRARRTRPHGCLSGLRCRQDQHGPGPRRQIKAELHHVPSQKCNAEAIEKACHDCWYVPLAGGFHIVLVDEADRMTPAAQLALLSKLDATAFPPNTVFIFTCNETGNLEPRFLSRCRVIEFSYGMAGEIAAYLDNVWHAEGGNGNGPDLARLAKEAGTTCAIASCDWKSN